MSASMLRLFLVGSMLDPNRKPLKILGSGALSGKMLLVRIVENNKIDDYFRAG